MLVSWLKYMAGRRLAPYVPAPPLVGQSMLKLAALQPGETVVDLGCGDGRLLRAAVDAGAGRAVGYELDAELVTAARKAAGDDARIEVFQADVKDACEALEEAVSPAESTTYPEA
jgi:predicted RNA methylase